MKDIHVLYDTAVLGMSHISSQHRTGTARATEELARALAQTPGCRLKLMASDFQGPAKDFIDQRLPGLSLIHPHWQTTASRWLYRHVYRVNLIIDDSRAHQWKVKAARLGIKATLAPFRPFLRRINVRDLREADVYHAPSGSVPAQLAGVRGKSKGVARPTFITIHDLIPIKHPEFFPAWFVARSRKWLVQLSQDRWYLCSSENTRNDLLETGRCDPAQVFVTPLAAGEEFFPRPETGPALRAKYGLDDAPYLLSVCTLEPRKNLDTVIRTFLRLIREESRRLPDDLKLVLVGASGWMRGKLQQACAEAGSDQRRIVLTGHVPEEDLPALYSHAMAFVYLSFYEGFGLPVLEAMRCGLPVISSDTSSLPEVVGSAGILQDPRDEDALASHLQSLCNDADLRADLSARALRQAATFSWKRCADRTLAAYRTALAAD